MNCCESRKVYFLVLREHRKRLEMESDLLARKISQGGYEEDKSRDREAREGAATPVP